MWCASNASFVTQCSPSNRDGNRNVPALLRFTGNTANGTAAAGVVQYTGTTSRILASTFSDNAGPNGINGVALEQLTFQSTSILNFTFVNNTGLASVAPFKTPFSCSQVARDEKAYR